jgi:microcystin-dependent protein
MSWTRDFFTLSAHQKPNVGDTKTTVVSVDHLGWLLCDGRLVQKSEYGLLFYQIGYTFGGSGDEFRLPDGRGRVIGTIGSSGGNAWQYGQTTGEEMHLMTLTELVSHNHSVLISTTGVSVNSNATGITTQSALTGVTTQTAGLHSHTTNATGGQGNPGLAIADGTNTVVSTDPSEGELNVWTVASALTVNSNGDHTHPITDPGHTHAITDPQHAHAITDPGHIHDVTNTGGSQPFNVMQPTIFMGNLFIYSGKTNAGAWPYTIGTNVA